jgi:hypothetical protein
MYFAAFMISIDLNTDIKMNCSLPHSAGSVSRGTHLRTEVQPTVRRADAARFWINTTNARFKAILNP